VLCLPPEDARRKAGWAGKPYPYVRCDLSAEGELLVQGPHVFAGYWRDPAATAAAFRDGWLLTGDVAERDEEGNYRIRGRRNDLVVSGGENVYPAEIEAVLHDHPAVADAAVVGVPDERWGELVVAYVVRSDDALDAAALEAHCHGHPMLAAYKRPRAYRFVDALPMTATGKKVHYQVRAQAAQDAAAGLLERP
jgi:acyl-CoA synthetase (AMP-forming)/AMP-acid ligase II